MKIAQIVCVYPPYKGGIATSAFNTARVLKSAGHEVKTFTVKLGGETKTDDVISLKPMPGLGKGGVLPFLCWRLRNFDVIYLNYPFFGTAELIWFLKKFIWKKKKKLIIHYHMDTIQSSPLTKILSLPARLVFNSLFQEADMIISGSLDYVKKSQLKNIYAKYSDKFVEIPYSVDLEKFKPEDSAPTPPYKRKAVNILFVGGLDRAHYFKGVDVLLEAFSKIKNCHLDIVGSGDLEETYKARARELGIAGQVNFFGRVSDEDLPEKYRQTDIFILPSVNKNEAFGIVLIEAMASGLPVIASDLPGVRGVFENNKQGLLCKAGDVADLAEKIKYLMDNPAIRAEMAVAARKLAEEKYDKVKIGNKLISK